MGCMRCGAWGHGLGEEPWLAASALVSKALEADQGFGGRPWRGRVKEEAVYWRPRIKTAGGRPAAIGVPRPLAVGVHEPWL
eukprot:358115-Chlamydomonas_euryale.AAC.3